MLRPPETEVNRCSGQHDDPGVGGHKTENVPETISPARGGELVYLVFYRLLGSMTGACTAATA